MRNFVSMFILGLLVFFLSLSMPSLAFADGTVKASLAVNTIDWPDDELICGGWLTVRGGSIINAHASSSLFPTPLIDDTANATSSITFSVLNKAAMASKKSDIEMGFLEDWIIIKRRKPGADASAICPQKACPINIQGQLFLCSGTTDPADNTAMHKIQLDNNSFILREDALTVSY